MRWVTWVVVAAAMVMLAVSSRPITPALAANDAMSLSLNVAGTKAIGLPFDVNLYLDGNNNNAVSYQASITTTEGVATWNPVGTLGWTYTGGSMGLVNDAGASAKDLNPVNTVNDSTYGGSAAGSGSYITGTGKIAVVSFVCTNPGVSTISLHMAGGFQTATIDEDGNFITVDPTNTSVTCEYQADLRVVKTDNPDPVVAGQNLTYILDAYNDGPNPAFVVVLTDTFDPSLTFVSATGAPYGCSDVTYLGFPATTYLCMMTNPLNPADPFLPGAHVTINFVVAVPLEDAGKTLPNGAILQSINPTTQQKVTTDPNQVPQPTLSEADFLACLMSRMAAANYDDPQPTTAGPNCDNVDHEDTLVSPANVVEVKSGPAQKLSGDSGTYTITVDSQGPSPATGVVVADTMPAGVTATAAVSTQGACVITPNITTPGNLVTCTIGNMASVTVGVDVTITITVTFNTAGTKVNTCTATWVDPPTPGTSDCNPVETLVLPPFNGMVKDARPDLPGIQDAVNLWLCKTGPDCGVVDPDTGAHIGKGILDVADLIFLREDVDSPNDTDLEPEGLAAYEEQIKYDHKVFDVVVADAGDDLLDNDADTYIDEQSPVTGDESVIRGPRGNIDCTMTIMTENWIMFGCVSAGQEPGNPMPVGLWLKTISLTPDPDMFLRLRPTKDNGVVSTIIDENCEVADIYASEPWPFTLPGGLTEDCTDLTVTVRMLEGDVNLDCLVNVLDMATVAGRYGATFGLLLYSPFYDLEPKLTDFDIDIKDLQFVFGRDGSMCQAPIPNQNPEPAIPDP